MNALKELEGSYMNMSQPPLLGTREASALWIASQKKVLIWWGLAFIALPFF